MVKDELTQYRFCFDPWNIHSGQDPFGPPAREEFTLLEKLNIPRTYVDYRKLLIESCVTCIQNTHPEKLDGRDNFVWSGHFCPLHKLS